MFQLFKKRDFSVNISDTIAFFKTFGKHYFKNYFTINGIFLLILIVLFYFIAKVYMEFVFTLSSNPNGAENYLSNYFDGNVVLFVSVFAAFILLSVFLSVINLTYPIIYLQFLEKDSQINFGTKEIIGQLKANSGKLIVFFFGFLFVILPILLIVIGLNFVLCFIIIGFPLFFVTLPAILSWVSLSFHEYLLKDQGFFKSLGNGFALLRQKFWSTIGTTLVVLIILQVVQGIITMVPYIIGIIFVFASESGSNFGEDPMGAFSSIAVLVSIILVFSVLLGYIFNNIIFVNQGLIYYGLREENEKHATKSEIDLIGNDSE